MDITTPVIEVPAGKFNESRKYFQSCFTSVYIVRHFGTCVFSMLDQCLAVGCLEKLGKNAASSIVVHRQVYRFVYRQDEYHDASMH